MAREGREEAASEGGEVVVPVGTKGGERGLGARVTKI